MIGNPNPKQRVTHDGKVFVIEQDNENPAFISISLCDLNSLQEVPGGPHFRAFMKPLQLDQWFVNPTMDNTCSLIHQFYEGKVVYYNQEFLIHNGEFAN